MKGRCVLLPQPVEEEALELLKKNCIDLIQASKPEVDSILPLMKEAEAVVLRTGIKMTRELLENAPELLTISRTGAGVDNVDLEAATRMGVIVTSSIGVNTDSVVEHTMCMIFSLFKQLFLMDREVRKGNFSIRYKNLPRDLKGKTLGILGFGRIGSHLALRCNQMLNMKIFAYDPYLNEKQKSKYSEWVEFIDIKDIFKTSDVISIHLPLTESTKGMVGKELLGMMKKSAFIINTSRGGIIKEGDLVQALKGGTIAGAALDVFEKEPPEIDSPLFYLDNVVLTPHSAALTKECVVEMAVSAVRRVLDIFEGFKPENIANPEVLELEKWKSLKKRV